MEWHERGNLVCAAPWRAGLRVTGGSLLLQSSSTLIHAANVLETRVGPKYAGPSDKSYSRPDQNKSPTHCQGDSRIRFPVIYRLRSLPKLATHRPFSPSFSHTKPSPNLMEIHGQFEDSFAHARQSIFPCKKSFLSPGENPKTDARVFTTGCLARPDARSWSADPCQNLLELCHAFVANLRRYLGARAGRNSGVITVPLLRKREKRNVRDRYLGPPREMWHE